VSDPSFDLQLDQHEGNCDLCFLKGAGKIQRIMRARPDLADWWIQMETVIEGGAGGTERTRRAVDRLPLHRLRVCGYCLARVRLLRGEM
jgi:hypothetical protein